MNEKIPSKDILKKIREDKIKPISHIQIYWKSYLFWVFWGVIVLFGAISFSLLLLNVLDIRPTFFNELGVGHYIRLLMDTAPYLWIVLVIIACGTGYVAMRKTRTGYRYSVIFITAITVLIISMAGALLHVSQFNRHIGERMVHDQRMSGIGFPAHDRWSRPDEGILGGRIVDLSKDAMEIESLIGEDWIIVYDEDTKIKAKGELQKNMFIGAIGEQRSENIFHAESIHALPPHLEHKEKPKVDRRPLMKDERPLPAR